MSASFHWGPHLKKSSSMHKNHSHNATKTSTDPTTPSINSNVSTVYWKGIIGTPAEPSKTLSNLSALHADNDFHMKAGLMRDMQVTVPQSYSFVMVFVLASIFLFVTMAVTLALVFFFRKKNSVFVLQKSEQEDYQDYEMQEIDTDVEYTSDSETETSSLRKHPKSCPVQKRGGYQLMVEARLDDEGQQSTSLVRQPKQGLGKAHQFYALTNMPPNIFHRHKPPKVNLTYTDSVQNSNSTYSVLVTLQDPRAKLRTSTSDYSIQYHGDESGHPSTAAATLDKKDTALVLPLTPERNPPGLHTKFERQHQNWTETVEVDRQRVFLVNEQESLLDEYFSNYAEEHLISD